MDRSGFWIEQSGGHFATDRKAVQYLRKIIHADVAYARCVLETASLERRNTHTLAQVFNAKTSALSLKLFSHWSSFMNLRSVVSTLKCFRLGFEREGMFSIMFWLALGDLLRREHV
jgi:hypothetical protein